MRRLVVLVLVGGLLVAADFGLRSVAEARLAAAIHGKLDTSEEPDVSLHGFPFVVRLVTARIPRVEIEAASLVRDGVRMTDVALSLEDVSFSWTAVLAGDLGSIRADDGRGAASLGAAALNELLTTEGIPVSIAIRGDRIRIRAPRLPRRVAGTLELDGRTIVLQPVGGLPPYRLNLPRIIPGVRYDSLRVEQGRVTVGFSLEDASFENLAHSFTSRATGSVPVVNHQG